MTVDTRLFTAEEVLRLPGFAHGLITARIAIHLGSYVREHRLGVIAIAETGFVISREPDTVLAPDVAFVRADRVGNTPGFMLGAPDLAVEVIAPSDLATDVFYKTVQYLRAGTCAVIEVDIANRAVYVHRGSGTHAVITTSETTLAVDDVVPGWKMPLAEIFEG